MILFWLLFYSFQTTHKHENDIFLTFREVSNSNYGVYTFEARNPRGSENIDLSLARGNPNMNFYSK